MLQAPLPESACVGTDRAGSTSPSRSLPSTTSSGSSRSSMSRMRNPSSRYQISPSFHCHWTHVITKSWKICNLDLIFLLCKYTKSISRDVKVNFKFSRLLFFHNVKLSLFHKENLLHLMHQSSLDAKFPMGTCQWAVLPQCRNSETHLFCFRN